MSVRRRTSSSTLLLLKNCWLWESALHFQWRRKFRRRNEQPVIPRWSPLGTLFSSNLWTGQSTTRLHSLRVSYLEISRASEWTMERLTQGMRKWMLQFIIAFRTTWWNVSSSTQLTSTTRLTTSLCCRSMMMRMTTSTQSSPRRKKKARSWTRSSLSPSSTSLLIIFMNNQS